jgi:hypothetical protein
MSSSTATSNMAGVDAVPITSWLVDQHDCADGPIRTEEVNVVEIEQRPRDPSVVESRGN